LLVSTVFDTNRGRIMCVSGNKLIAEMSSSRRGTGADLGTALIGAEPPDDAFAESIAEAISKVTTEMTIGGASPTTPGALQR
jgi:hypothetical protein